MNALTGKSKPSYHTNYALIFPCTNAKFCAILYVARVAVVQSSEHRPVLSDGACRSLHVRIKYRDCTITGAETKAVTPHAEHTPFAAASGVSGGRSYNSGYSRAIKGDPFATHWHDSATTIRTAQWPVLRQLSQDMRNVVYMATSSIAPGPLP